MPEKRIKLRTVKIGEAWKAEAIGENPQIEVDKNSDGLDIEFHNVTNTNEDPGPDVADPPDIKLSFIGFQSRSAFNKPKPNQIFKQQPYRLKPAGKGKEVFKVRDHLGLAPKGTHPMSESIYGVIFRIEADDRGEGSSTSGPDDTEILIEC